ncbi:HAD family hydrolase [Haladaptatus sp. DYSN1]|uniref:HAD family hydrolase n=1 Tax=unclassified Haladaptatus TaxID=2622732 RepID=UPI002404B21C|nr:HAD family hydrolase [Haladaptatus sp. DYSN1]
MIRAVGFDLDYTLAVPERDRQTLLHEAAAAVDAPQLSRQAYLDAHRRNLSNETREPIFADLLADHETQVSPADLSAAYRNAINNALVPVSGAKRLVDTLRKSYRVGLLTDGPIVAQQAKLERLGWQNLFDATIISGALPAGKPDGRAFRALLAELDAEPAETVYIGDHPDLDVQGAKDMAMYAVHVVGPDEEPSPVADAVIDRADLVETLPKVLKSF